jgi:hypothetical protein
MEYNKPFPSGVEKHSLTASPLFFLAFLFHREISHQNISIKAIHFTLLAVLGQDPEYQAQETWK